MIDSLPDNPHAETHLAETLHQSRVFSQLNEEALADLEREVELCSVSSGEVLIRQGDPSDSLYMVISGWLRILARDEHGKDIVVSEVGRSQTVGEMGLLTGEVRSATVIVARDSLLARLSREGFDRLLKKHPQSMTRQFATTILNDLRREARGEPKKTRPMEAIAVVPLSADVPVREWTEGLARAMEALDSTVHLHKEFLDASFPFHAASDTSPTHANNLSLIRWLGDQERRYRFLLYEADSPIDGPLSNWTERCLRHADRILFVGFADHDPPKDIEARLPTGLCAKRSLVLLHRSSANPPRNTHRFLDAIDVEWHQNIRLGEESDRRSLARRLTGRAVGLVLSSGASRGFAHIGALRAIVQRGVEIDFVGGTSIGSVNGALFASHQSVEAIEAVGRRMVNPGSILDYTIPLTSLLAGGKLTGILKELFDDRGLEDSWLPFFCVSSDLRHAQEVVHDRGDLWAALRASCGVPGGFPPFPHQGRLLADGAIFNPLPIDAMRQRVGTGKVIAIDVTRSEDLTAEYEFGPRLSGWELLASRIFPWKRRIESPPLKTVLRRILEISSIDRYEKQLPLADVVINAPVTEFGMTDVKAFNKIVALGYEAACRALDSWEATEESTESSRETVPPLSS